MGPGLLLQHCHMAKNTVYIQKDSDSHFWFGGESGEEERGKRALLGF